MSYNKIIEELIDENEQLKQRISNLVHTNTNLQNDLFSEQLEQDETEDYINKLKKQNEKLYKPHEVFKFKEQIERLKIDKYKYIELYKQKYDENKKLSDELTLKIRHNHIQTLEINELKQELKEYRGF